jgi:hypothetical protein
VVYGDVHCGRAVDGETAFLFAFMEALLGLPEDLLVFAAAVLVGFFEKEEVAAFFSWAIEHYG